MIKLKKVASMTLLAVLLASPALAVADEFDAKIQEQDQKIEALEKDQKNAEKKLQELQTRIGQIEQEIEDVLASKLKEEQRLNEINTEIADLKEVIAQRDEKLKEQARDVQVNHNTDDFLAAIINSESINEAFGRALALNTIVDANNEILQEQQKDKERLEELSIESEERIRVIEEKSAELHEKQQELVEAQLDQEVAIQEIQVSVATEKKQKQKFIKQKEEAERKRQEQLKALAEQRAREEAARKKIAEEEARAAAEAERQAQEQAAQQQAQANAEQAAIQEETQSVAVPEPATTKVDRENLEVAAPAVETKVERQEAPAVEEPVVEQPVEEKDETPAASSSNSSGWASPVSSISVSSPFGMRANPTGAGTEFHNGIDLVGSSGTPIFAAKSGTVVQTGFDPSGGNYVIIDHGDGYFSHYLHLSSIGVANGQTVSQGATVGGMGTTGNSTGVHLHFGIGTGVWSGFVNPAPFIGA
jgi:murein DD-endopeptidase MepM/ murein hydrolase activator NlpD